MNKRNIFAELTEGFEALMEQRTGKRTLRTHKVDMRPELKPKSRPQKS